MSKRAALAEEGNEFSMEISQDNELNLGGGGADGKKKKRDDGG